VASGARTASLIIAAQRRGSAVGCVGTLHSRGTTLLRLTHHWFDQSMRCGVTAVLVVAGVLASAPRVVADDRRSISDVLVYVHYHDPADRPLVDGIAEMLESLDYRVMDKRLVNQPTSGDVRFFYEPDRTAAVHVQSIVENFLLSHGWSIRLALLDRRGRFESARPGLVEVWIPKPPPNVE